MRNIVIAATFAGFVILPAIATAQEGAVGGAAAGAVTGGVIGGPPGAAVGAAVGGTVGAASESQARRRDRVIVRDPAPGVRHRTCVDRPGRRDCVETRR